MSTLWRLISVSLKHTYGLSVMKDRYLRKRERLWEPILALVGIGVGFTFFGYFFLQLARAIVVQGAAAGQPELAYGIAILGMQLLLLIMGIFMVISAFYFTDDISILVPLPLKPWQILTSKLAVVTINEYLTGAVLFIPAAIAYTQLIGGGLMYWLSMVLVFLLLPILPLVVASLVALMLMKFINRRHRDLMMVIASLVLVVIILAINFSLQASIAEDPAQLQRIITERFGLVQSIGNRFPPAVWATKAIAVAGSPEGFFNLGLFLGVTTLGLLALAWSSERLFYAGLIGGGEVTKRRRKLTSSELTTQTVTRSVFSALFWREWKIFLRTPIFAMNGFMGALIMPIAMIFPLLAQGKLPQFQGFIQSSKGTLIFSLVVAALIAFLGSINTIASTSVSREGKLFYISKMIPIPAKTQVQAKLAHGFVGALVSAVPITIAFVLLAKPGFLPVAAAIITGLVATVFGMGIGLLVDMFRPFLTWTNPQQAVKQNFNAVIPMFVEMPILFGVGMLTLTMLNAGWAPALIYGTLLGIFAVAGAVVYFVTVDAANRLYHKIDL